MIKKIVIAIVCIASTGLYAQNGSVSPYSYFGIGDIQSKGTIENQMMGGIGMFADSIHLNLKNPAAYSGLGIKYGEDFGNTTYTVGLSHNRLSFANNIESQSNSVTNLEYIAVGMALKKGLGIGFGIMPYSSVGYDMLSESTNGNDDRVLNRYYGDGGLNKVYFSIGYEFMDDLSVGVTANFNFGTLENNRVQTVEDVQYGTLDKRSSKVNGMDFNYALNYTPSFKDKYRLFASVRVNTQANLTSKNTKEIGSFAVNSGANIEVVDVNLDALNLRHTELKVPTTTTLGLGFGEDRKWFVGGEYSFQGMGSFTNDFVDAPNLRYQDASSFAFGGFYIPDYSAFSGYFKRMTYRAGLRFDKTGMLLKEHEINNFGITFGFGLPMRGSFSNLNLGFEVGRKGTKYDNLIEENYFKVNVGLSLNDIWFRKRRIN
ncbi:hypothetical protein HZY62_16905 [Maribacter polysiphoniae]|uniref:Long-subunit fatty acid transport protein n=1 Tax=Maribacter polysiphoniae TaxID=429344 RepID=A0A316E9C3_9FLAO|nr:hypothetical protein [Maribacter polysiphoniae]MBD1262280.1 hypothetical protein [Maribacter polysiphoniae]PWK25979.1 hypothetical protein LX92_00723 [Maribacter polysiphoniae]